ncbi:MAG: cytochrome c [Gammaproteobacteria bacterium]|jgi:mono/diheme cytochrome c family protein|nr:cytochrome c [Gammaproteobacteria bacterium]
MKATYCKVLLIVMCGLPAAAATAADTQLGAELYYDYCARCHGENREGVQNFSDDLQRFSERLEGITEDMPDFAGFFEPEEVAALYAFLALPHDAP